VLEAAICGYEASLRIGLATQPAMFQRGFMATPTCGTLGAALAVAKLLKFKAQDMAGALGAASSYAGGLAQFYHSGSFIKRINGGRGAESGVMAALLTREGIWGPRDILEGESGFFRAYAEKFDASKVTGDLGDGYRMMEVSTKAHAGAGRLQATVDAGLALGAEHKLVPEQVADVEVGIPKVVAGKLTHGDPPDLQSAQLSIPFSLAMALALGRTRGPQAGIRRNDYEAALKSPAVCALSTRVRCVVDAEIEAGTNTEEVPSRRDDQARRRALAHCPRSASARQPAPAHDVGRIVGPVQGYGSGRSDARLPGQSARSGRGARARCAAARDRAQFRRGPGLARARRLIHQRAPRESRRCVREFGFTP
jgi:2-methylcitrate dehydratase PrpD